VQGAKTGGGASEAFPGRFICLLYHDIYGGAACDYGRIGPSAVRYHVSERAFDRHLDLVARSGTRPVGAEALGACLERGPARSGQRGVAFSFDDGWEGAVTRAAARLGERAIPAFIFVTTDFIGRRFFARPEQLRRLDPGLVTVGSHGVSHRMLSSLTSDGIRRELRESRRRLEDILGRPVECLSVPGGAVDRQVVRIAQEVGYTTVFTSAVGVNPTSSGRWGVARVSVMGTTTPETLRRWLAFRLYPERLRSGVLAVPKRLLGMRTYAKLRRVLLGEAIGYDHVFEP